MDSFIRLNTERTINTDMNIEQIGSAIIQPNKCIKTAETITPTEPKVSAKMCRKTPRMICELLPPTSSICE